MRDQRGVAILISVLIIGAAASVSALMVLYHALSTNESARVGQYGVQSMSIADGCAERALLELQSNNAFTGGATETINGQTCSYTVTNLSGSSKQIDTSATVSSSTTRVRVIVNQLNPQLIVESWRIL